MAQYISKSLPSYRDNRAQFAETRAAVARTQHTTAPRAGTAKVPGELEPFQAPERPKLSTDAELVRALANAKPDGSVRTQLMVAHLARNAVDLGAVSAFAHQAAVHAPGFKADTMIAVVRACVSHIATHKETLVKSVDGNAKRFEANLRTSLLSCAEELAKGPIQRPRLYDAFKTHMAKGGFGACNAGSAYERKCASQAVARASAIDAALTAARAIAVDAELAQAETRVAAGQEPQQSFSDCFEDIAWSGASGEPPRSPTLTDAQLARAYAIALAAARTEVPEGFSPEFFAMLIGKSMAKNG